MIPQKGGIMPRPKEYIDENLAHEAANVLSQIKDAKLSIRLQAIISSADHPINRVADVMGISRQTVWRWIKNFQEKGRAGLVDRAKGHRSSKLTQKQLKKIEAWLDSGKDADGNAVHWTVARLQKEVEKRFGIYIGTTPLWRHIRKMGFKQKVPRPIHAEADKVAQAEFKKNCVKKQTSS